MQQWGILRALLSGLLVATLGLVGGARGADAVSEAEVWPGWRGPTRDGLISKRAWPKRLAGDAVKREWRIELGPSYSGPVVDEKRVYVTETVDKKVEAVRALDRRTGRELWKTQWEGAMTVPFFAASNGSWIRSTPTLDEGRLYVAGMRDRLVCLDAATGNIVWNVDFTERYSSPLPAFGFVSSPLVDGDVLYVQAGASVLKLDKKTGATLWRSMEDGGGMYGSAFSSPVLATIAGASQVVVQMRTSIAGLDPKTGKVLWSHEVPAFRGMNILTPLVYRDAVFTSSYGGGSFLFRVNRDGDSYSVTEAWTNPKQGYMSSPVLIDGHLFLHMRNQRMVCLEWESGKEAWTTSERFGKYMSLVSQGDSILALDERGILLLIAGTSERFELVDSRQVTEEPSWAHLAITGQDLLVRDLTGVASFQWSDDTSDVKP